MSVYTMVAVIGVAMAAVPIGIVWLVQRRKQAACDGAIAAAIEQQMAPLLAAQEQTEQRLRVLEALATDPAARLAREITLLDRNGESPSSAGTRHARQSANASGAALHL